ncbi:transcriptional regulator [Clostridium sp. AWRP]|uniref:transcriptional regulator n=1 Tax=Clostridium sp. AWRP TaxID=2212991 RepID=UPI000FD9AC25|nr:transcriptional regulator [Clostridium sp. AWRP]AZV58368.1 transcriptional regulator [Clostridium sp. AWRP]
MDTETFKNIEDQLCDHFIKLKEIAYLEQECEELKAQAESIEYDIKSCNVSIDPERHMSPLLMEKVQTSPTGESAAEKGIIREIENLEHELDYVKRKVFENRSRIRELNRDTTKLTKVLSTPPLPKEYMDFITYKYKLNRSVTWIANEMYGGIRSTAYRRRKEVINYISELGMVKMTIPKVV